jgi:hypothetical protein
MEIRPLPHPADRLTSNARRAERSDSGSCYFSAVEYSLALARTKQSAPSASIYNSC